MNLSYLILQLNFFNFNFTNLTFHMQSLQLDFELAIFIEELVKLNFD
jgi:hypothetical protein